LRARSAVTLAASLGLFAGCGKHEPPGSEPTAAAKPTGAVPAVPPPSAAPTAPPAAPSVAASTAPRGTVAITDPGVTPATLEICAGEPVAVILPSYPGSEWAVGAFEPRLGPPKHDVVERWLGPNLHGERFTWSTAAAEPDHEIAFVFTDRSQPTSKPVTVTVDVQICDDEDGPVIGEGFTAAEVEARLGKVTDALLAQEGQACFVFERAPDMQYCFGIDTEQATWKQVRRRNFEVNEVKGATQSDKEMARSLTPRRRKT
jgi:hypothetical protein